MEAPRIDSKGHALVPLVAPPPRAAGSLPLLGHAIRLPRDNLGLIASPRASCGPLTEITLQPGTPTLVVQDPDRRPDGDRPRPTHAFPPPGAGKHKRIGDRFARTELVTAIATITRRVRLELASGRAAPPVAAATVRPRALLTTVRGRRDAPASPAG
ncbi:hypothetical protein [Streptomyces sp. E2N166]|uniref:hypothetical protein n=1 Tax=Streptomyces sp. E2N166 TaxID=1851909 RepID=UPI000EF64C6C|nr:hypothetical protein [Streptomyces sp. E2N166]